MTPRRLATPLHSLPPILHMSYPESMLSYSKGARGLSVPLRVLGIFTETTISPSSRLRQRPDRYTIRAGRNFAEFLGRDSLERLRILSSTTCVGLRYGQPYCKRLAGFLGSLIRVIISLPEGLEYYRLSASSADLPTKPIPTDFNALFRQCADLSLLRHHITQ